MPLQLGPIKFRSKAKKFLDDNIENTVQGIADALIDVFASQDIEVNEDAFRDYIRIKWFQKHRFNLNEKREPKCAGAIKPTIAVSSAIAYAVKYLTHPVYDLHLRWKRGNN